VERRRIKKMKKMWKEKPRDPISVVNFFNGVRLLFAVAT
jgi:hypothetical protein